MKRMSEVFALPMTRHGNKLRDSYGEFICDFPDEVCAEFALSAFNNTDALADALGDIVFDYFATINLSNVDMANLNPELHKKMTVATDALAAYRGYK